MIMAKTVINNYILYTTFDDCIGQAIYTLFDTIKDTVQTVYNKQELKKIIGE